MEVPIGALFSPPKAPKPPPPPDPKQIEAEREKQRVFTTDALRDASLIRKARTGRDSLKSSSPGLFIP
jgi:hypothetical protein